MDLHTILSTLSTRRPVFHSEADFQHELAWQIHCAHPQAAIRLEYPRSVNHRRMEIDIWVTLGDTRIAIELKYKTKKANLVHNGEQFSLAPHAATPLGRYDFWRDAERLECLRAAGMADETWAIFLTNDGAYWSTKPARGNGSQFSMHANRQLGPNVPPLVWKRTHNTASIGKGRVSAITLHQTYQLVWANYSGTPQTFCFLALKK